MEENEILTRLAKARQLVNGVKPMLIDDNCVKCIQDGDGQHELTTDPLLYFTSLCHQDFVHDIIEEASRNFSHQFSFGVGQFLFIVQIWCDCYIELMQMGISSNIVNYACSSLIQAGIRHVEKHSVKPVQLTATNPHRGSPIRPQSSKKPIFNRYSRHTVNQFSEETISDRKAKQRKLFEEFLEKTIRTSCQIVKSSICELFLNVHEDKPDFNWSTSENIFIDTCINSFPRGLVLRGITIPLSDWSVVNNVHCLPTKRIALYNSTAYGVEFANDVTIRESVSYKELQKQQNTFWSKDPIVNSGVNILVYRGELPCKNELVGMGVICVRLDDYYKLYCLSRLLSVEICCDLLNVKNVAGADVTVLNYGENVNSRRQSPNCFLHVGNLDNSSTFYTVMLCNRTLDCVNLLRERFTQCQKRVQSLLVSRLGVPRDGFAERKLASFLAETDTALLNEFCCPAWIWKDVDLFAPDIKRVMAKHLQKYIDIFQQSTESAGHCGQIECFLFRKSLWTKTHDCIVKLVNTRFSNVST